MIDGILKYCQTNPICYIGVLFQNTWSLHLVSVLSVVRIFSETDSIDPLLVFSVVVMFEKFSWMCVHAYIKYI